MSTEEGYTESGSSPPRELPLARASRRLRGLPPAVPQSPRRKGKRAWAWNSGLVLGPHSPEHRAKISAALRGRPVGTRCVTHGHTRGRDRTATYRTWQAIVTRCTNPRSSAWKYYGGHGIQVCERWRDFRAFVGDMGERPAGMTIDRIDVDGNYEVGGPVRLQRAGKLDNEPPFSGHSCFSVKEKMRAKSIANRQFSLCCSLRLRSSRAGEPEMRRTRAWVKPGWAAQLQG